MPACTLTVEVPPGGVVEIPDLTGELTATDNRTPLHLLIVEQDPPPGTLVSVGAYIITTTITDQSGNTTTCTNIFCVTAGAGPGPFFNTPQSFTATCPAGTTGSSKTAVIPAGTYTSNVSQADADAQALAAAAAQANAALCCCPVGEECEECLELYDDCYPYGYGFDDCLHIYDAYCYPYGYGCPDVDGPLNVDTIAYWKLNETADTRFDSGSGGFHLFLTGTLGAGAGIIGNSVALDSSGNTLVTTSESALKCVPSRGFTLWGWARKIGASVNSSIVAYTCNLPVGTFLLQVLFLRNTGTPFTDYLVTPRLDGVNLTSIQVPDTIPESEFHFWRIWFDPLVNKVKGEVAYASFRQTVETSYTFTQTPTNGFVSMNGGSGPAQALFVDEVGLLNRVMTSAEYDYLINGFAGRTFPFTGF